MLVYVGFDVGDAKSLGNKSGLRKIFSKAFVQPTTGTVLVAGNLDRFIEELIVANSILIILMMQLKSMGLN